MFDVLTCNCFRAEVQSLFPQSYMKYAKKNWKEKVAQYYHISEKPVGQIESLLESAPGMFKW